jgi:hypothetical protein
MKMMGPQVGGSFLERNGASKEKKHYLNKGELKVKQLLKNVHATNVQLETPPNCKKKTFVTKS